MTRSESAAANRIIGRGSADAVLAPSTCALLYDSASLTRGTITGDPS
jgi:hypothetical protein